MQLPDFSKLPFWEPPISRGEISNRPSAQSRVDDLDLTPSDFETIYRRYVPDLAPVGEKEHRGKCPIHGTAESGNNFSVHFASGRCRCLSHGCVEGYVYEFVATINGWSLPKELRRVKQEVRRLLGHSQPKSARSGKANSGSAVAHEQVRADASYPAKWKDHLLRNSAGAPRPILSNAVHAFRNAPELQGIVGLDEFATQIVLLRDPPWPGRLRPGQAWTEEYDAHAAVWLQREGLLVGKTLAFEAVQLIAHENGFHPVREYLNSLRWDGNPRIDNLLTEYFGCPFSEFTAAVGKRWLIGGVSRIYKPGSKVDTMLILEGSQGIGKSSALRVLGGDWFTDSLGDLRTQDAPERIQGKWIVEVSELDSFTRADATDIKAFLSRTDDRFRPAYARRAVDLPRQSIFAGTTNGDMYLKDSSGGRRFWPVRCGVINLERLREDRDQLWAEAVERYNDGAVWWLPADFENEAKEEQAARRQPDPWEERIWKWFNERERNKETSTWEVLTVCLEKHSAAVQKHDEMRVGECLRALGFERKRVKAEGRASWVYRLKGEESQ